MLNPVFVSTRCLPSFEPLEQRVERMVRSGFRRIELGSGVSCEEISPRSLHRPGIRFLVHNYFPPPKESFVLNLASGDPAVREKSLDLVLRAIALCAEIRAPFYSVHAGFITDPVGFGASSYIFPSPDSRLAAGAAMERFVDAIIRAGQAATRYGVGLLVENNVATPDLAGKLLLQDTAEMLDFFSRLGTRTDVGILLDTGHLKVTARTLGFDPLSFITEIGPLVRAVHLHDNDGREDNHRPVEADSWIMPVFDNNDFAGLPIIVEADFADDASLKRHVNYLEKRLQSPRPEDGLLTPSTQ